MMQKNEKQRSRKEGWKPTPRDRLVYSDMFLDREKEPSFVIDDRPARLLARRKTNVKHYAVRLSMVLVIACWINRPSWIIYGCFWNLIVSASYAWLVCDSPPIHGKGWTGLSSQSQETRAGLLYYSIRTTISIHEYKR
jgi:hypothetical protein